MTSYCWKFRVGQMTWKLFAIEWQLKNWSIERRQVRFLAKAVKFYGIWNKFHILKCSRRFLFLILIRVESFHWLGLLYGFQYLFQVKAKWKAKPLIRFNNSEKFNRFTVSVSWSFLMTKETCLLTDLQLKLTQNYQKLKYDQTSSFSWKHSYKLLIRIKTFF